MTREELENAPYAAPLTKSIRAGRVMMIVGVSLLLLYAFSCLIEFIVAFVVPDLVGIDFSNPLQAWHIYFLPVMITFLVFVTIGGISFVREKGPLLRWASIGAIVLAIIVLIDLFVDVRSLAKNLQNPAITADDAWSTFLFGFFGMQIPSVIYLIGWWKAKNYLG